MPACQGCEFQRCRLPSEITSGLEPGVLEDDSLVLRCPLNNGVYFGRVATLRHPKLYANHGTIAHTAVELLETEFQMVRVQIDECIRPMIPMRESLQDLIIVPPQVRGRRVESPAGSELLRSG